MLTLDQAWDSLPSDQARYEILQFNGLVIPTVEVNIEDDDVASLVVWQTGTETFVSEGSDSGSDVIEVSLGMAPPLGETVTVRLDGHGQLEFRGDTVMTDAAGKFLQFNAANYGDIQFVTLSAIDDSMVEGFHRADFTLTTSNGVTKTLVANVGDNDHQGVLIIESNGSTDVAEGGAQDTYEVVLTQAPGAGEETLTLEAKEFQFEPATIEVVAGQPVKLVLRNTGSLEHDFSVMEIPLVATTASGAESMPGHDMGHMAEEPDLHVAAQMGQSAELEFTATRPGTYEFFCAVPGHKEAGMVGTLVMSQGGAPKQLDTVTVSSASPMRAVTVTVS